jgi:hypothetical protein
MARSMLLVSRLNINSHLRHVVAPAVLPPVVLNVERARRGRRGLIAHRNRKCVRNAR